MTHEEIEKRLIALERAFLNSQKMQAVNISKTDDSYSKIPQINETSEKTGANSEEIEVLGDAIIEMSEIIYQ